MKRKASILTAVLVSGILFTLLSLPAVSQPKPQAEVKSPAQPSAEPARLPEPKPFSVSRHQITIDGKLIPYTATVGEISILKADEKPGASMFFVAYTRDDVKDKSGRPIMFCFNGGPGSSTVWLHLGGIGPKKVALDDEGRPLKTPADFEDSDCSLLDVTDLVFVDAVSTGYSRPLPGEEKPVPRGR